MKAEQLKAKIRNAIATSIYTGSLGMGMNGYDDATEKCLKIIDEYARIQIEKDRSETKRLMNDKLKDFEGLNPEIEDIIDRDVIFESYNNTPIILD
jgi:hypothetical protein